MPCNAMKMRNERKDDLMNLKEAFRYQNYLTMLFSAATSYLRTRENLVRIKQEHLRKSVNPDAQDEIMDATAERPYAQNNGIIIAFANAVLEEKYALCIAIDIAKSDCYMNIDAETQRNTRRRELADTLNRISSIKPAERKTQGSDFKFTATGEQARYYYTVKETTAIDFDRTKVKVLAKKLAKEADAASTELDRCIVSTEVDFIPAFDVSDSVEDALSAFEERLNFEHRAV